MNRDLLLHNSGYWVAKIQLDLYKQLKDYIKNNKTTRTKLAEKLGVTKSYISQILNGDFDFRISKLVELSIAIDKIPIIEYEDVNKYIYKEEVGFKEIKWDLYRNEVDLNKLYKKESKVKREGLIIPLNQTCDKQMNTNVS